LFVEVLKVDECNSTRGCWHPTQAVGLERSSNPRLDCFLHPLLTLSQLLIRDESCIGLNISSTVVGKKGALLRKEKGELPKRDNDAKPVHKRMILSTL
jgi:hypothetical protein